MFGCLSLAYPRLEELNIRADFLRHDDESGPCLLGRLKILRHLQIHTDFSSVLRPGLTWLRRRTKFRDSTLKWNSTAHQWEPKADILLGRLASRARRKWVKGHPTTSPLEYLQRRLPLPTFQKRKLFLTDDGVDLGGIARPDDLIMRIMENNKDLLCDVLGGQRGPLRDGGVLQAREQEWNRDAACLPLLELFYFRAFNGYKQDSSEA